MARVIGYAMQVWDVSLQVRTAPLFSTSFSLSHSFLDTTNHRRVSSVLCEYQHQPFHRAGHYEGFHVLWSAYQWYYYITITKHLFPPPIEAVVFLPFLCPACSVHSECDFDTALEELSIYQRRTTIWAEQHVFECELCKPKKP